MINVDLGWKIGGASDYFTALSTLNLISPSMSDDIKNLKHKIDPDQPDAHRFEDKKEIFFQDEFEEALTSICEHVARLDSVPKSKLENINEPLPDEEKRLLHRHSTISIFGQRGVGKTSFLLTIKDAFDGSSNSDGGLLDSFDLDLELEESKKPKDPENLRDDVWTLDSIDPSLIENEDKLLVTITSTILDHVRRNNDGDLSKNQAIQDALEDLSRRFRILFPDATENVLEETASDPLRFAGEVLFDADSGPKLAKAFHRFLALAAEDLSVKCFLLPIDDVDTSFDKGWPLLETLRKYLSTDRLITVVSGDLEFFDLIVQQKAHARTETYREAEAEYSDTEYSDNDKRVSSGEDLRRKYESIRRFPGQYLQKIFPVNNRLRLPDIHSVVLDSDTDLDIETHQGIHIPLGSSVLLMSRLLFGTPYVPNEGEQYNEDGELTIFFGPENSKEEVQRIQVSDLSNRIDSNSIDALLPPNTRRFISFLEDIPELLDQLTTGAKSTDVAIDVLNRIAENHSSLLRSSGIDVGDIERLTEGGGYSNLTRTFFTAQVSSGDLASLESDLFRDHSSYDQWRALLSLVAGALYVDWSSTLTGPIRYMTKVKDTLSVAKERDVDLETLGTGLNEPSWKSRCRLLRTIFSDIWEVSGRVESFDTAMRVPRKRRNSYKKNKTFARISPDSSISPDYLRWWKAAWERGEKGKPFKAKNRAVMPESIFLRHADLHAHSIYGMFRVALRRGTSNFRYIDFRRGLARIDDMIREYRSVRKRTKSKKIRNNIDMTKMIHESADFVLRIRGNIKESFSTPSTDEEVFEKVEDKSESSSDRESERLKELRKVVNRWCSLAVKLSSFREGDMSRGSDRWKLGLIDGASLAPSPWVAVNSYDRFITNSEEIADLPWRQHTVGTILERHTMSFLNSVIQKEVQFRIRSGQIKKEISDYILSRMDFGLVRDSRNSIVEINGINEKGGIEWSEAEMPQNSFTRNVKTIVDLSDKLRNSETSLLKIIPYTSFWLCCPFLLTLMSREIYTNLISKNKYSDSEEDGIIQAISHSVDGDESRRSNAEKIFQAYIKKSFDGKSNFRPKWQKSSFSFHKDDSYVFDIHDILSGIARADSSGYKEEKSKINKDNKYLSKLGLRS